MRRLSDDLFQHTAARRRLGGFRPHQHPERGFNTQPPEGGWIALTKPPFREVHVSTHSRPKAAGG
ncbi:hypothetical protein MCC93_04740 [Morococcus cerebrosus]|uniref:Uncharacterized protein n=1 Tax=Morococcus cerebrosus TaxID=1056807 RepID=A0A0C1ESV3_9NEIS|nr:hypothetical protein MCC93_04740 [Morococcus cerebrosus]